MLAAPDQYSPPRYPVSVERKTNRNIAVSNLRPKESTNMSRTNERTHTTSARQSAADGARPQALGLPQQRELWSLLSRFNCDELSSRFPDWRGRR